jgi:hypothetical protein
MKKIISILIICFISFQAKASCDNFKEIAKSSLELSNTLDELRSQIYQNYRFSHVLQDLVMRTYLDSSFLHQISKNGSFNCDVLKNQFMQLKSSHHKMTYRFERFSLNRNVEILLPLWNGQEIEFQHLVELFE